MQPGTLTRSDTQFISGNASVRRVGGMRHISGFSFLFRQRDSFTARDGTPPGATTF